VKFRYHFYQDLYITDGRILGNIIKPVGQEMVNKFRVCFSDEDDLINTIYYIILDRIKLSFFFSRTTYPELMPDPLIVLIAL